MYERVLGRIREGFRIFRYHSRIYFDPGVLKIMVKYELPISNGSLSGKSEPLMIYNKRYREDEFFRTAKTAAKSGFRSR